MSDLLSELGRAEDEDFESAWAAKWDGPSDETETQPATEEAPAEAETAEPEGQPRDEHGRFARVDTPAVDDNAREDELAAEEEALAQTAATDDPVESLLAKYNGDVRKALEAAAEAQSLIGRKESERSAAQQELQELRTRLDQLEQTRTAEPTRHYTPLTEADVERLDGMVYEGKGQAALVEALQRDPSGQLGKRVMDSWAAVSPGEATAFMAEQIAEAKVNAIRAELEPVRQASAQNAETAEFQKIWGELAAEVSDLEQLVPGMNQLIETREGLARAIVQSDPATKKDLLRTLAESARSLQEPHVQESIAAFEAERAEASRAARTSAAVVAPKAAIGSPPGGGPQTEKTPAQQEADRIRAGVLESTDTSISAGWTTE